MTISDLLAQMGCHKIRERGFEITASCPFAPWLHEGGRDRHPSFGVNMLLNEGQGVYHCFACGKSGTVKSLIRDFCQISGQPIFKYSKYLEEIEQEYELDLRKLKAKETYFKVPDEEINRYYECLEKRKYHSIFKRNNIYPETVFNWGVAIDDEKIIFPVKDRLDNILFFVYRWTNEKGGKYSITKGAKTKSTVFGMNMVDVLSGSPLIIVEGVLDAMYLNQLGFNAVGIFGVFLDNRQIDKIKAISPSDKVVVIFDDDDAGRSGAKDAASKLSKFFVTITKTTASIRMLDQETINSILQEESYVRTNY